MALLEDSIDFVPLFPTETEEALLARAIESAQEIAAARGVTIDTREGSMWRMNVMPAIRRFADFYDAAGTEVPASAMVLWSWSPYLDDLAVPTPIDRNAATFATGTTTFAGDDGTVIAAGVVVGVEPQTDSDPAPTFVVTTGGTIAGGFVDLPVRAEEAGSASNVAAGAVTIAQTPLPGVDVSNAAPMAGGSDVETDEPFRDRLITAFEGTGPGNDRDYLRWARDFDGVGDAVVVANYAGRGTVLVVIVAPDGSPAGAPIVEGLQEFLDPPAFRTTTTASVTLPQASIPVATTAGARPAADGWIRLGNQLVHYTDFDGDSFNGCSGGTGTFASGSAVTQSGRGGGEAPVGAHVVVKTAAGVNVTIAATVEFDAGHSLDGAGGTVALRAAIEARIAAYVRTVLSGGEVVRQKIVSAIVSVTGVHDVGGVTINGVAANLGMAADPNPQIPILQPSDLTEGDV